MRNRFFWDVEPKPLTKVEPDNERYQEFWKTLFGSILLLIVVVVVVLGIPSATIWCLVQFKIARVIAIIFVVAVLIAKMVKVFAGKKAAYYLNHYDEGPLDDSIRSTGSIDKKEES